MAIIFKLKFASPIKVTTETARHLVADQLDAVANQIRHATDATMTKDIIAQDTPRILGRWTFEGSFLGDGT